MKLFKAILIGVAVCASFPMAKGETTPSGKGIIVVSTDGTRKWYMLSTLQRVNVGTTGIQVATADGTTDYTYPTLDRVLLNQDIHDSVDELLADGKAVAWLEADGATLRVAGGDPGRAISVYDMAGALVASAVVDQDGRAAIDISAAPAGAYVLTIDNSIKFKFLKH